MLDLVLWSVQGFLALFFFAAGAPKVLGRGLDRWVGFSDLPRPLVVLIGGAEVLGAACLVLPMVTGVLPWLTPLAAIGLSVIVLMASGFHLRADERLTALETTIWAAMTGLIAFSRWDQIAGAVDIPRWLPVALLAVLTPTAISIVLVLWRRLATSNPAAATATPGSDASVDHRDLAQRTT